MIGGHQPGMLGALLAGLLACAPPATPPQPTAPVTAPTSTAATAPAAEPAPARATVRHGDIRIASAAGIYLAVERGYFAEQGLDVRLETFASAVEQIPALANSQIEIGIGAVSAGLFNAVARGVPLKLTLDFGRNLPNRSAGSVAVRKDLWDAGAIREPADLRGRPIAVNSTG